MLPEPTTGGSKTRNPGFGTPHAAWQRVNDALDAASDDWDEHLRVNPRPG